MFPLYFYCIFGGWLILGFEWTDKRRDTWTDKWTDKGGTWTDKGGTQEAHRQDRPRTDKGGTQVDLQTDSKQTIDRRWTHAMYK